MISPRAPVGPEPRPARPRTPAERQPERAARQQAALECAGQDRQRLERVRGHTYLVFRDRATADEVLEEIAATPIVAGGLEWPVQIWQDGVGAIGTFEASDGRVAVGHVWTSAERAWLAAYVDGWRSVQILDALPAGWRPKEDPPQGRIAATRHALCAGLRQAGLRVARFTGLDRIAPLAKSMIGAGRS
jgi:hypothetical protein